MSDDKRDTPVVASDIKDADRWREHVAMQDEGDMLLTDPVEPVPIEPDDTPVVASGPVVVADEASVLRMLLPFENTKALLLAVHRAQEEDKHLRGVQINVNDRQRVETLVDIGYLTLEDVSDKLGITTEGRLHLGIAPNGVLDLPVEVAEVTGNVEEKELAARYCEGKIRAIDKAIAQNEEPRAQMMFTWQESYEHCALTLRAMASEFRQGMHTPDLVLEGRVIPYNEDRSTGVSHARTVTLLCEDIHGRNVQAGWWHDLETGQPKDRNPLELIALCHSELSEATEGVRKNLMDDHLPHRKMEEVEMADCVIRIADYCGGRGLDLGGAIDEKLAYNARRADHKPENRLKSDGKKM